jgi:23S rRNA (guanosine2251-2'-O)-methyltransferase
MNNLVNVFGIHAALSLLTIRPEDVITVYYDGKHKNQRLADLISQAQSLGLKIESVETKYLEKLTGEGLHQGICLSAKPKKVLSIDNFSDYFHDLKSNFLMLVLDQIQDPHNLGACLRTALAFDVDAVLLTRDRSAGLSSTVSKVSCGADQQLRVFEAGNLSRAINQLKSEGVWFYGADQHAKDAISNVVIDRPTAIVMGSEGRGLRRLTADSMDQLVSISISNSIESLNVSVATGIFLHSIRSHK